MPISMSQLDQLADRFGFRVDEAREFLGLPLSSSRGKVKTESQIISKSDKPKQNTKETTKRGKSGYQAFMSVNSKKITDALKNNLKPGEKLAPGAAIREIGAKWKALSDSQRARWNEKAASM
tara:strand:- start:1206 stop:1571 length:366 start_codon:yes stop_codon:yes gene_type:complete